MGRTSQSTTATDTRWLVGAIALSALCHAAVVALLPHGARAPNLGKRGTTWMVLTDEAPQGGRHSGQGNRAGVPEKVPPTLGAIRPHTPQKREAKPEPREQKPVAAPRSSGASPTPSTAVPPGVEDGEPGTSAANSTGMHIGDVGYGSAGHEGSSGESTKIAGQGASSLGGTEGYGAANGNAELHARLAEAARGCYPRSAVRFGLRGEAQVAFCIGTDGVGRSVEVRRSSGEPRLDAAIGCVVERASPFPAGARGQCFVFPLVFGPSP